MIRECKFIRIGTEFKGIGELFLECIESLHDDLKKVLLKKVIVTGGMSKTNGFIEKLYSEIRENLPRDLYFELDHKPDELFYVEKMKDLVQSNTFSDFVITKKIYEEYGSYALCRTLY